MRERKNGLLRGSNRARDLYRSDPFLGWLYRDPRRAASLSVLFTVGTIVVWLTIVFGMIVYLALKVL